MARRQRTSAFEDLMSIAGMLPWWLSLLLALVSYLILHSIATRPLTLTSTGPNQLFEAFFKGMIPTMCTFGQIVIPFIFGLGGVISWLKSGKDGQRFG